MWNRKTLETNIDLFSRQCNQIYQKREDMADKIQEISRETQQLKAKIQSLRDVCSKETEKAQVPVCLTAHASYCFIHGLRLTRFTSPCQALYDTLSMSIDELHKRVDAHVEDMKHDVAKMSAVF